METHYKNLSNFSLCVDGKKESWEQLFSESLYQTFVSKMSCKATAMKKYDIKHRHLSWLREDLFTAF